MWFAALPVARTPLWQLKQLLVTPACDMPAAAVLRATPAATALATLAASVALALVPAAALAVAAGAPTTAPTLLPVAVTATTFFALPPPQLLGLWQPLQSVPVW